MTSAKGLQRDSHAGKHGSNGNGEAAGSAISYALRKRQIPEVTNNKESTALVSTLTSEKVTNEVPKVRGAPARHDLRGNFSFMVNLPYGPSVFVNDVLSHLHDGKLALEMGRKLSSNDIVGVFRSLNSRSFSAIPSEMRNARSFVFGVLERHSRAIYADLWIEKAPATSTVLNAIHADRRISRLFASREELESLEDMITSDTGCPGFLPIETMEKIIVRANGHGGLTLSQIRRVAVETVEERKKVNVPLLKLLERKGEEMTEQHHRAMMLENQRMGSITQVGIAWHVMNDSKRYPVPEIISHYRRKAVSGAVVFINDIEKDYYARIVLLGPNALQVLQLPDGTLVGVHTGEGITFVGLSPAEQEFLLPKYISALNREEPVDDVEQRRIARMLRERQQEREFQLAEGAGQLRGRI